MKIYGNPRARATRTPCIDFMPLIGTVRPEKVHGIESWHDRRLDGDNEQQLLYSCRACAKRMPGTSVLTRLNLVLKYAFDQVKEMQHARKLRANTAVVVIKYAAVLYL